MKSLRGLAGSLLLLTAACTAPPEGIKVEPKPAPAPSPLDKLDSAEIPAETRKLAGLPELVAFVRGHNRAVAALAFSPDGKRLATSGWDNAVVLWDVTGAEPNEIARLDGSPSGLVFTPDGKTLVTGSPEPRTVLWDISGDKPKVRVNLGGHKVRPFPIAIAPGGKMLASGSLNPMLRIWKLEDNEPEAWAVLVGENAPALGISSLSFSSDGKLLASGAHIGKPSLRIWDVSGDVMEERTLPAAQARLVAFSPKGPLLAFAADDGAIHLWSFAAKEPKTLDDLKGHKAVGPGPTIKALAFTPDGQVLASGGQDQHLILWNVAKGVSMRTFELAEPVRALAFAPDGRHLAVGNDDGTISILRLKW